MLILDHALSHQVLKWLVDVNHAQVTEDLSKEARIQKVQNCVFDAANVVIYRHPTVHRLFGERKLGVVWIAVAQIVQAGTSKGVHGVSDALCGLSALWTGGLYKLLALSKSVSCCQIKIIWKHNRKLIIRNRNVTATIAVNHRNWIAPITLPGNEPVTKAELDSSTTNVVLSQISNNSLFCLGMFTAAETGKRTRLDENTHGIHWSVPVNRGYLVLRNSLELLIDISSLFTDDRNNRQVVLLSKVKVAFIA